jgi:hypothetical protein
MINVGSYYIASENIKSLNYEYGCLVVTYFFDNSSVMIPVVDFEDYKKEAEHIRKTLRRLKAEENAHNNK